MTACSISYFIGPAGSSALHSGHTFSAVIRTSSLGPHLGHLGVSLFIMSIVIVVYTVYHQHHLPEEDDCTRDYSPRLPTFNRSYLELHPKTIDYDY